MGVMVIAGWAKTELSVQPDHVPGNYFSTLAPGAAAGVDLVLVGSS